MEEKLYELPTIFIVGGETHTIRFNLMTMTGQQFDAKTITATFSMVYYINRMGIPLVSKQMEVQKDASGLGTDSVVSITLSPDDTKELYGKYIYQVTLQDLKGATDIIQGVMMISNNIDSGVIK